MILLIKKNDIAALDDDPPVPDHDDDDSAREWKRMETQYEDVKMSMAAPHHAPACFFWQGLLPSE